MPDQPDRSGQPEDDRDRTLEDFLQGGPRSEEWRLWRVALQKRLADLKKRRRELKGSEDTEEERRSLDEMIGETEAQILTLATEEVITEFVESEVDLSLNTIEGEDEFGGYISEDELHEDGRK